MWMRRARSLTFPHCSFMLKDFIFCVAVAFSWLFKQDRLTWAFPSSTSTSSWAGLPLPPAAHVFTFPCALDHMNLSLPCCHIVLISCLTSAWPLSLISSNPLRSYQVYFLNFFSGFLHVCTGALHLRSISTHAIRCITFVCSCKTREWCLLKKQLQ